MEVDSQSNNSSTTTATTLISGSSSGMMIDQQIDTVVEKLPSKDIMSIGNGLKQLCMEMMESKSKSDDQHQRVVSLFLELKHTNRWVAFDADDCRALVDKEKQKLDQVNLLYENYIYEKNHLLKEIHSTCDFDISDKEPKLVSDEYMKSRLNELSLTPINNSPTDTETTTTPTTLASKYLSSPTGDVELDNHNQRVNRLQFELDERLRMLDQLNKLNQKKKLHTEINMSKQNFLSTLPKSLSSLSTKLSQIGTTECNYNPTAFYLPKPLYYMYSSVISYQSSCKKPEFNIKINGEIDKSMDLMIYNTSYHPLSIILEYSESNELVTIQFYYVQDVNVVECTINQDQSYLSNLFPNDPGVDLINPTTTTTTTNNKQQQNGKIYRWAQLLCGLMIDQTINRWSLVSMVMQSIEKRIQMKQKLKRQITDLKKQLIKVDQVPSSTDQHQFHMTSFDEPYENSFRILFTNKKVQIQVEIMIYDSIDIPPLFRLLSISSSSNSNNNNILLEKDTIKSIENELNSRIEGSNGQTLIDQISYLKSILSKLSSNQYNNNNSNGNRFRRGKLRSISFS